MDRIVACRYVSRARRVWCAELSDLHRRSEVGVIPDSQIALSLFDTGTRCLAEILIGAEKQLAGIVVRCGVSITICIGGVDRATQINGIRGIRQIEGDEATIPVGDERQPAIIRGFCAMSIVRIGIASLSGVEWTADILNNSAPRCATRRSWLPRTKMQSENRIS